ncbi:MAG: protein kinase [Pseudonocardia sp.]|nr:protein kinase [Pseudonocardia sp.]
MAAGLLIADRYLLDRRIAVGGMGEVWEASDTRLGRSVAVKILRPELSDDPEFLHRFRIEARTVASLDHAGIAAVHDYGEDDADSDDPGGDGRRTAYLVMELVRGEPLSAVIARGPVDTAETLRIIEEAARALQAAHERGFVHRDVKPGNILVRTDGLIKITDFGIAKAADAVPVTRSGMVMGTAHYIAPEQASGSEAGPAGDVYSLGIVGYECLAGHRPFRAESAVAVAMMQVRDAPPPLPDTVPRSARELIESVLVKDPTQRYATGGEFAEAVAAVRRGQAMPVPSGRTPGSGSATVAPGRYAPADPVPVRHLRTDVDDEPADRRQRRDVHAHRPDRRGRPVAAPMTEPLRLRPAAGPSRGLLLVLFVLLTVAAVVFGIFLFRSLGEGDPGIPQGARAAAIAASDIGAVR